MACLTKPQKPRGPPAQTQTDDQPTPCAGSGLVVYGDHGTNLKAEDWRAGRRRKVANHLQDLGFTDAMAGEGEVLAASYYDIDAG